jgi:hypothetical protein
MSTDYGNYTPPNTTQKGKHAEPSAAAKRGEKGVKSYMEQGPNSTRQQVSTNLTAQNSIKETKYPGPTEETQALGSRKITDQTSKGDSLGGITGFNGN